MENISIVYGLLGARFDWVLGVLETHWPVITCVLGLAV